MEENLLCEIDEGLAEMRLLIEGAATLYASDAESLSHMAMDAARRRAADAEPLSEADEKLLAGLYALRKRICVVQDAHMKAVTENQRRA